MIKNIKLLKKDDLLKINKLHGYIFDSKTKNKILINNLLKINNIKKVIQNTNINNEECPICFKQLNKFNYIFTKCGHFFCKKCIFLYITNEKEICPLCRQNYTYDDFIKSIHPLELKLLICYIFIEKIYQSNDIYENLYFNYFYISIKVMCELFLLYKCMELLIYLIIDI
jgi:hypothetical protein